MRGFHAQNGLYFDKMKDGRVKITKVRVEDTSVVEAVYVIDKNTWTSVVNAMEVRVATEETEKGADEGRSGSGDADINKSS